MTLPDVYLSLGSNIVPEKNLQAAVDLLRDQCDILAISPVYQSPPYGKPDQADFLDVIVKIKTVKAPLDFKLKVLRAIEKTLGRVRSPENKFGPLTLDMDILLWGGLVLDYGEKPWHIPNTGLVEFAADALPMVDLAPDLIHPETGETMIELVARLDQTGIIKTEIIIT